MTTRENIVTKYNSVCENATAHQIEFKPLTPSQLVHKSMTFINKVIDELNGRINEKINEYWVANPLLQQELLDKADLLRISNRNNVQATLELMQNVIADHLGKNWEVHVTSNYIKCEYRENEDVRPLEFEIFYNDAMMFSEEQLSINYPTYGSLSLLNEDEFKPRLNYLKGMSMLLENKDLTATILNYFRMIDTCNSEHRSKEVVIKKYLEDPFTNTLE